MILVGFAVILIIMFGAFKQISKAIDKSPDLALLDGSEQITYHRIHMAAKNVPVIPDAPAIVDPLQSMKQIESSPLDETES